MAGSIVLALIAVDSLGVVSAVLANAAAFVTPMDVQRLSSLVNFLGVDTFVGVAVAVASCGESKSRQIQRDFFIFLTFTLERSRVRVLTPLFLFETRAALFALNAASVVLARAS
jgi:hypothetical protein